MTTLERLLVFVDVCAVIFLFFVCGWSYRVIRDQMTSRSRVFVSHALARRAAGAIACVCSLDPEVSPQVFNLQLPTTSQTCPRGCLCMCVCLHRSCYASGRHATPTAPHDLCYQDMCFLGRQGHGMGTLSVVPVKCWLEKCDIGNASVSFFGFRCDSGRCPW